MRKRLLICMILAFISCIGCEKTKTVECKIKDTIYTEGYTEEVEIDPYTTVTRIHVPNYITEVYYDGNTYIIPGDKYYNMCKNHKYYVKCKFIVRKNELGNDEYILDDILEIVD